MATSSSSALAVIPSRDISISRDVTMADEEPEVYTVPKFVAEVYEKTKEQLRVFATQLANTEEMARLSQQQQEAIKGYDYRLEQNLAEISLDVLNRGISQGYGPATSVIERRDISGFALRFARRDVTAQNAWSV
jgi:hypothetical protein